MKVDGHQNCLVTNILQKISTFVFYKEVWNKLLVVVNYGQIFILEIRDLPILAGTDNYIFMFERL